MMTQHLAGGGFLEALGGAFMSFEFWHKKSVLSSWWSVISSAPSS
jgi:hypothetical protein